MEDWALRSLARWPDVPALYGWLGLDRRGRWLIRGETITRPQIIDTINRNYAADARGRWYFQNGPQRGYVELASAPLILRTAAQGDILHTHTGLEVSRIAEAYLDEEGSVLLTTEHGAAAFADHELDWLLPRLATAQGVVDEPALAAALALPSSATTALSLWLGTERYPLQRLDRALAPATLGYVRVPVPQPGERAVVGESARAPD